MRSLGTVASIQPGYAIRGRLQHDPKGIHAIIQPSDIDPFGHVEHSELARVQGIKPRDYHYIKPNTVLFVAYGTQNRAYYLPDLPDTTVARSTFYLIRPKPDTLDPRFLAWYLNQPRSKHFFETMRAGATVQIVRRDGLKTFEVPLPPMDLQRTIAKAAQLVEEEEATLRQIAEKRRAYIDARLLQLI